VAGCRFNRISGCRSSAGVRAVLEVEIESRFRKSTFSMTADLRSGKADHLSAMAGRPAFCTESYCRDNGPLHVSVLIASSLLAHSCGSRCTRNTVSCARYHRASAGWRAHAHPEIGARIRVRLACFGDEFGAGSSVDRTARVRDFEPTAWRRIVRRSNSGLLQTHL
jgi:hypothetical protein